MEVSIPIVFQSQGGGFYFLREFENYLRSKGHKVHKSIDADYDILFTNHWMISRSEILRALRRNLDLRIVQRIDGAAQDYGRDSEADRRQRAVNQLTDRTIFQSEYCRYSTREKYQVITQDGPVIHNPVDLETFNPQGPKLDLALKTVVAAVTWSDNPYKGAASVFAMARANPDVGFVLCGRYPDAPDLPNIHKQGVLGRQELAKTLRSCDALVTFSQNEACPNHVLEALASGLPVLYVDSGAMAEVIGESGLPVTEGDFREQLDALMADRTVYSRNARIRAEKHFSPELIFGRYVETMQAAMRRPPRRSLRQRQRLVQLDCLLKPVNSAGPFRNG